MARQDGLVLGFAEASEPQHEYTDAVFLAGAVDPRHQGHGIGRALLEAVSEATARPWLRVRAYAGTAGERALPALGFEQRLTHVIRALDLREVPADWDDLRAAAGRASSAYLLRRHVGPTADQDLAAMVLLREAINDAPDALEREEYRPERIAAYEQSLVARGQTQHTITAWTREGEPAGITMVCVDEHQPEVAHQEDTSVVRSHRGRRLGLRMKLAMADWLREERPDVARTHTWNDGTNRPMIAVNEQLGAAPVAASSVYVRRR